eukprot:m.42012 g.42012  ORF g.42012 m.42012 type:complete len:1491 (+) comp7034_c0_seq4:98-4570(+)
MSDGDLHKWLQSLKLLEYYDVFKRSNLSRESVVALDDAELERLGIDKLGHRKRLLKYVDNFGTDIQPILSRHPTQESTYAPIPVVPENDKRPANIDQFTLPPQEAAPERPTTRKTFAPPPSDPPPPMLSPRRAQPIPSNETSLEAIPPIPSKSTKPSNAVARDLVISDGTASLRKKTMYESSEKKESFRRSAVLRDDCPLPPPPHNDDVSDSMQGIPFDNPPPPPPKKVSVRRPVSGSIYNVPKSSKSAPTSAPPLPPKMPPPPSSSALLQEDHTQQDPRSSIYSSSMDLLEMSTDLSNGDGEDDGAYFQLPRGFSNAAHIRKANSVSKQIPEDTPPPRPVSKRQNSVEDPAPTFIGTSTPSNGNLPVFKLNENPLLSKNAEKRGYLDKKGGLLGQRGWDRRFCMYKDGILCYFINEKDPKPQGSISLADMKGVSFTSTKGVKKHMNRFTLQTYQRTYYFSAESSQAMTEWLTLLGTQIQLHKPEATFGGKMSNPDVEGWLRVKSGGSWSRRYLVLKGADLHIYLNFDSYKEEKPKHTLNAIFLKVKVGATGKKAKYHQFQLLSNTESFEFQASTREEMDEWTSSINDSIAQAFNDMHSTNTESRKEASKVPKEEVYRRMAESASNKYCADCGCLDPEWMSINLGTTVCLDCSGIHRGLGTHISKMRSYKLDDMEPSSLDLVCAIGSAKSNTIWEALLEESGVMKPNHLSTLDVRKEYINKKYGDRAFFKSLVPTEGINTSQKLFEVVATDDVFTALQYILAGASASFQDERGWSIARNAYHHKQLAQVELLRRNDFKLSDLEKDEEDGTIDGINDCPLVVHHEGLVQSLTDSGEWLEQHAVFDRVILTFYVSSDLSSPIVRQLPLEIMRACEKCKEDAGHNRTFSITTVSGKVYRFAAGDEAECDEWVNVLKPNIEAIPESEKGFDFEGCTLSGSLERKKEGGVYETHFYALAGRTLLAFVAEGDPTKVNEIDLRNVIKYENGVAQFAKQPGNKEGYGIPYTIVPSDCEFSFILRTAAYRFRAADSASKLLWLEALKSTQVFGIALDKFPTLVPRIVEECCSFIESFGCLTEGVYRIPGTASEVNALRHQFDMDQDSLILASDTHNVHVVAAVLKLFFKELPNPLINCEIKPFFYSTLASSDDTTKLEAMVDLLSRVSYAEFETLKRMCMHLSAIGTHASVNKMTPTNLALVFGPTFCFSKTDGEAKALTETNNALKLVEYFIQNCDCLFGVEKKSTQEQLIEDGISKIEVATSKYNNADNFTASSFLFSIQFNDEETPTSVPVAVHETSKEVVDRMLKLKGVAQTESEKWSVFESSHGGKYIRALPDYETISSAAARHIEGSLDLCVSPNRFHGVIESSKTEISGYLYYKLQSSAFMKMAARVSLGKKVVSPKWKRVYCRFNPLEGSCPSLRIYKNEDLLNSIGIIEMAKDKRVYTILAKDQSCPPTDFCFFINGTSKGIVDNVWFCADDEKTMIAWVATLSCGVEKS